MSGMEKRREILRLIGLAAGARMPSPGAGEPHLQDQVVNANGAHLTREPFGDNRVK